LQEQIELDVLRARSYFVRGGVRRSLQIV